MDQFIPLVVPQSHVNIDSNRRSCPSDGFNYPTFRLANKTTRVYLSEPLNLDNLITYRPFAVANVKGWFAAVRNIGDAQDIIFSPLQELRDAFKKASEDDKGFFFPQRDLSLDIGLPTMLAFAHHDTRLVVGVDNGSIYVYDTAALFSSGSDTVNPFRTYSPQVGALRQIAPNPGTEPDLIGTIAVVRSDGSVQLLNTKLESLGGWSGGDSSAGAVAVSWSPKGKHLAIGLRSGDIVTFAPNNKSTPNKHIPPAAEGRLVGLSWLSPGHTFRLTYASQIENEGQAVQQLVSLDTKSNVLTVFDTLHPFIMNDRPQESHALILPHWDEESILENAKSLVVIGDRASVDLEILGGYSGQWYQHSQENPVSLPLDKNTEETVLMTLEVDLTDLSSRTPILYAYLNDGSLQAWHLEHFKPYPKMIPSASEIVSSATAVADEAQDSVMDEKEAAGVLSSLSAFNQQPPTTSGFGAPSSGSISQSSVFSTAPAPTPVFGQPSQPSFGQTSGFGTLSPSSSAFGQSPTSQPTPSVFGTTGPGNAFSNIAAQRSTTNVFGSPSFGVAPSAQLALPSDGMTREASMSDGTTPAFSGLSLGGNNEPFDDKPKTSVFGSLGSTPSSSQTSATSAFGGLIKPAQGFGAFSHFGSTTSPSFIQGTPTVSAFSSTPQSAPHSAFGQTSFGQPSFGQTGFGAASSAAPSLSSFAAFASSSPGFGSTLKPSATATSGFAAFASGGASAFGSTAKQDRQTAGGAFSSPFGSKTEQAKSPFGPDDNKPNSFGPGSVGALAFGNAANAFTSSTSSFGLRGDTKETTTPQGSPVKPSPRALSPPSSPELSGSPLGREKTIIVSSASSSSILQQSSSGLGALASIEESSPFFKKTEARAPVVTAFGDLSGATAMKPPASTTTTSGFGAPSQLGTSKSPFASAGFGATATFGAMSKLGAAQPAFGSANTTQTTKPPVSGGFGAFSGGTSGFSAFAGQKTSFSDLLKKGDKSESAAPDVKEEEQGPSTPSKPKPAFTPLTPKPQAPEPNLSEVVEPTTPSAASEPKESTTPKGEPDQVQDPSLSNISLSSMESFVDVSAEKSDEEDEKDGEDEGDDTRSFLSSDFSSGPPSEDEGEASDEEEEHDHVKGKGKAVTPPGARSPSPTPQPEVPAIYVTPSPPAEAAKQLPTSTTEESTTPPGSPSQEAKVLSKSPSPTPPSGPSSPSTPSSPSPSPFVVGLGRPSTRPARSSPLASAPVSRADEEEEDSQARDEIVPKPSISPKPPLGQVKRGDDSAISKRPGTPPLLSSFGTEKRTSITPIAPKPEPAKSQIPFALPPSPPPNQQPIPVFSRPVETSAPVKQESSKPATTSAFGNNFPQPPTPSEAPRTTSSTPPGSSFILPPFSLVPRPTSAPQSSLATPSLAPPHAKSPVFAQGGPSAFATLSPGLEDEMKGNERGPGLFGTKAASAGPFGQAQVFPAAPIKAAAPPAPSAEEGLQKECAFVVSLIENDLKELGNLGLKANQYCAALTESLGGSRLKADLGVPGKWKVCDARTFGQTLLQFEKDLVEMNKHREAFEETLRQVNSSMLKANTRREEISRFNKAKNDKEFAKMLSTRALGPEHLESQQRLRRTIRATRDRIQKLESHLQQSKRKLSQTASARPAIRAPTLDVINRTYRNIDIAIQQQGEEIARLSEHVAKLKLGSFETSSRDARLPDRRRGSVIVTPNVAVTTAAALNAERSAQKLKKALLKARKEPILNQRAALAPLPPLEVGTPHKSPKSSDPFGSMAGSLFTETTGEAPVPLPDMSLNLPEDNFHPGPPLPSSRRGASMLPKKHGSVPLKKTPGGTTQSPPAAPASDFWGPLPVFNNPPLNKLAAEVKAVFPPSPTPPGKTAPTNSLPGGGFEAFMKSSS